MPRSVLRSPPRYERDGSGSIVDAVEPRIRELLKVWPDMPTTVIAERIGWTRSIRVLRKRVSDLRPVYLPPDPASRTAYVAGEIAQCDLWFPPIELPVGFGQTRTAKQLPVLTMVCGYSRWLSGLLLPTRTSQDLFAGWWQHIDALGAVPRVLVWDGESAIGRWRGGRSELTAECQAFRGVLGAKVLVLRPADPEAKGIVERAHDYLERSFLPGRTFSSPADFNTQLASGSGGEPAAASRVGLRADRPGRRRQAGDARPAAGGAADRVAQLAAAAAGSLRAVGQQRLLGAPGRDRTPGRSDRGSAAGAGVLRRADRCRSPVGLGLASDDQRPAHVEAAKRLRRERIGVVRPVPEPDVEVRCLADYDDALGLDDPRGRGGLMPPPRQRHGTWPPRSTT